MQQSNRNLLIVSKHRRLTRLWQFFFTGWGLVMVAVLVAASIFTKQILWTPISAINMKDIVSNQFKMTNAYFVGQDKDNNPFKLHVETGRQTYDEPDIIYLEKPSGTITRTTSKGKVVQKISSKTGEYNRNTKVLTLRGHVRMDSSDGDKILTEEMVIEL